MRRGALAVDAPGSALPYSNRLTTGIGFSSGLIFGAFSPKWPRRSGPPARLMSRLAPVESRKKKQVMRQNVPWALFGIVAAGLIAATPSRAAEYAWGAISIDASDSTTSPAYASAG